ncbi:hypothetical protein EDC04DRAFT_2620756 [Pisolithus marmoratus]|nr:hypothetical protein EDC04DRAFT_2620756 [Pisolithus marmoratus]
MSSARQWFTKRILPTSKPSKDIPCPVPEKNSSHGDGTRSPSSFKFNTLGAVVGRKPRKLHRPPPSQDQVPISPSGHHNPPRYSRRPPSKSVSSTVRPGDDFLKLQTPSDAPKARVSLNPPSVLTLSDPDPFAPNAISVPGGITDSDRTISIPNSPTADVIQKENTALAARASLTTSSSHSHRPSNSSSPDSLSFPSPDGGKAFIRTQPERNGHSPYPSQDFRDNRRVCIYGVSLVGCDSAATLTEKTISDTPPLSRPRGHTESAIRSSPSLPQTLPNVVMPPEYESVPVLLRPPALHRRASALRIATDPPCAPPLHAIPAVPKLCESDHKHRDDVPHPSPSGSGSSCSISFASSASLTPDENDEEYLDYRYRTLTERPIADEEPVASIRPPPPGVSKPSSSDTSVQSSATASPSTSSRAHSLKKSASHSTLQRKHRSFHQAPRPLHSALPHPSSCTPATLTSAPGSPDARRGIPSSPPVSVRKRLFSGSSPRRPSTATTEDDLRSVFSLPSEKELNHGSISLHSILLNDADSEVLPSGTPTTPATDYAQQIMSPAEMFAVEAKVQSEFDSKYGEVIRNRQRTISSVLTPSPEPSYMKEGFGAASSAFTRSNVRVSRNPVPQLSTRPSIIVQKTPSYSGSLNASSGGLPLPPSRLRGRPHTADPPYGKLSNVISVSNKHASDVPFISLTPPPRKASVRPIVCGDPPQKLMIRKPSFLDITDEAPLMDNSFLDLEGGRESLDLSTDEGYEDDIVIYVQ